LGQWPVWVPLPPSTTRRCQEALGVIEDDGISGKVEMQGCNFDPPKRLSEQAFIDLLCNLYAPTGTIKSFLSFRFGDK